MRFAVWTNPTVPWEQTKQVALHAEKTGWDSVFVADHFMNNTEDGTPIDGDFLEVFGVMTAIAALTERIKIGSLVLGNTYRHPAVVANQAGTLDAISNGRFILGLGAGWQVNEHKAYGIELPSPKILSDRFEEAVPIIKSLIHDQRTTFHGEHYDITDAPNDPKPVNGKIPILIGASGEKRSLKTVATYADQWNIWSYPELFAQKRAVLEQWCTEVGRDHDEISLTTQALVFISNDEEKLAPMRGVTGRPMVVGTPSEVVDIIGQYRDNGVNEFIVPTFNMGGDGGVEEVKDTLDLFKTEVVPHFPESK